MAIRLSYPSNAVLDSDSMSMGPSIHLLSPYRTEVLTSPPMRLHQIGLDAVMDPTLRCTEASLRDKAGSFNRQGTPLVAKALRHSIPSPRPMFYSEP